MKRVYLDYAAATPIDKDVKQAMQAAEANFANPSAQYNSARNSKKLLDSARKNIAMFLGANQDEIVLTSGATEANNLAILGAARACKKGNIVYANIEHASVREPIKQLRLEGFDTTICKPNQDGIIDINKFKSCLTNETVLVSIAYANSEFGTIQPLAKLVKVVREFEKANNQKIIIHTDASAAALLLNCDVARLGVDLLTISSNKIYGPKGIGILYVKRGTKLQPIMYGGSQELGIRAGSENIALAVGFAKALDLVKQNRKTDEANFKQLYQQLLSGLEKTKFILVGHKTNRINSVVSFIFEGINAEDLVAYLNDKGFEVATGAACEASIQKPSQSLLVLGYKKAQAQSSLRVSFGRNTTKTDVQNFTNSLIKTLEQLRRQT